MKYTDNRIALYTEDFVRFGVYEDQKEAGRYLSNFSLRGGIVHTDTEDKRKVYVYYDELPKGTREAFGEEETLVREYYKGVFVGNLVADKDVEAFYYGELQTISIQGKDIQKQAVELAKSAALIERALKWIAEKEYKKLGCVRVQDFYEFLVVVFSELNLVGTKSLKKAGSLRLKLEEYRKVGKGCLISGKIGQQHAVKMTQEVESILGKYYANTLWNSAQIHVALNEELTKLGITPVSLRTVGMKMNSADFRKLYDGKRYGQKVWNDEFDMVTHRKPPSRAGLKWVIDGSPLEIYYKYSKRDKEGNLQWTYRRLYLVAVIDAYSWAIVGYSIGHTETRALVMEAVKDAIKTSGYAPKMFEYDNSSAIKGEVEAWLKDIAKGSFAAAPGNARSKVIEPLFGHLFESQCKRWRNFSGLGIRTKKKASHLNEDYIRKHWRDFPEEELARLQVERIVMDWNNAKLSAGPKANRMLKGERVSPIAAQRANEQLHDGLLRRLEMWQQVDLFWIWRTDREGKKQPYKYKKEGIKFTISGKDYKYEVAVGDEAAQIYFKIVSNEYYVKYDPDDLSMIALYENERFVMCLGEVTMLPGVTMDYQQGDAKLLRDKQETRKRIKALQKQKADENLAYADELGANGEELLLNPLDELKAGFGLPRKQFKDEVNEAEDMIKDAEVQAVLNRLGNIYKP